MAPLRVPPEFDDGRVRKNGKACSVEEAEVPKQDELPFDGCESDVLMCLILQAALVHDSVLLVTHRFVDCTRSDGHL